MNWCVTTKKTGKEKQINFRVSEEVKFDLEVTAEIRGLSVSSWIHFLIVQASHIAKAENMARFQEIAERHKKEQAAVELKTETNNARIVGTPVFPELEEVKPKKRRAG